MTFMKRKPPPILLINGRNIAIVVVVLISAVSFTLGYFVGKSANAGMSAGNAGETQPPPIIIERIEPERSSAQRDEAASEIPEIIVAPEPEPPPGRSPGYPGDRNRQV